MHIIIGKPCERLGSMPQKVIEATAHRGWFAKSYIWEKSSPYVSMRDTREGAAGDDSGICSVPVKASWLLLVLIESIAPMGYTKGKM